MFDVHLQLCNLQSMALNFLTNCYVKESKQIAINRNRADIVARRCSSTGPGSKGSTSGKIKLGGVGLFPRTAGSGTADTPTVDLMNTTPQKRLPQIRT